MYNSVVLIPSLEPDQHLVEVVEGCLEEGLRDIVVIDDGSSPACRAIFDRAEALGAVVVRHSVNRGKGAALKTGLRAALERFPRLAGVVTADGDGQHLPADIRRVAETMEAGQHPFVLGIREFSGEDVPWRSRMGNRITAALFHLSTGVRCPDTQTGLRGIPRALFDHVLTLPGDRYEYEINMLTSVARSSYSLEMIPIQTVYEDNNRASHFRPFADSIRIYQRPLKYIVTAVAGCGIDLGLFALLIPRLGVIAATVLARLVSGGAKAGLRRLWGLGAERRGRKGAAMAAALFLGGMLASALAVNALAAAPLPLLVVKLAVDALLFAVIRVIRRRLLSERADLF